MPLDTPYTEAQRKIAGARIAEAIKAARLTAGLKQSALADLAGVSEKTVRRAETKGDVNRHSLRQIAGVLKTLDLAAIHADILRQSPSLGTAIRRQALALIRDGLVAASIAVLVLVAALVVAGHYPELAGDPTLMVAQGAVFGTLRFLLAGGIILSSVGLMGYYWIHRRLVGPSNDNQVVAAAVERGMDRLEGRLAKLIEAHDFLRHRLVWWGLEVVAWSSIILVGIAGVLGLLGHFTIVPWMLVGAFFPCFGSAVAMRAYRRVVEPAEAT